MSEVGFGVVPGVVEIPRYENELLVTGVVIDVVVVVVAVIEVAVEGQDTIPVVDELVDCVVCGHGFAVEPWVEQLGILWCAFLCDLGELDEPFDDGVVFVGSEGIDIGFGVVVLWPDFFVEVARRVLKVSFKKL